MASAEGMRPFVRTRDTWFSGDMAVDTCRADRGEARLLGDADAAVRRPGVIDVPWSSCTRKGDRPTLVCFLGGVATARSEEIPGNASSSPVSSRQSSPLSELSTKDKLSSSSSSSDSAPSSTSAAPAPSSPLARSRAPSSSLVPTPRSTTTDRCGVGTCTGRLCSSSATSSAASSCCRSAAASGEAIGAGDAPPTLAEHEGHCGDARDAERRRSVSRACWQTRCVSSPNRWTAFESPSIWRASFGCTLAPVDPETVALVKMTSHEHLPALVDSQGNAILPQDGSGKRPVSAARSRPPNGSAGRLLLTRPSRRPTAVHMH